MKTIRERYTDETLEKIFLYFMRTILNIQTSGIAKLPLESTFAEPVKSYLDLAVELIIDGQPPEVAELVLESEFDFIRKTQTCDRCLLLCLHTIRKLSCHIHYDADPYGYLLSLCNLWGCRGSEYASRTFYPNMPQEMQDKYQIGPLMQHFPKEMLRMDDY